MNGGVSTGFDELPEFSFGFNRCVLAISFLLRNWRGVKSEIAVLCAHICGFAHMLANTSTVDGAARQQHFWRRLVRSPTGFPN
jgi:hypothetical protein